jgi:ABC-type tungstate transport system substrate-binding protein
VAQTEDQLDEILKNSFHSIPISLALSAAAGKTLAIILSVSQYLTKLQ